MIIAFHGGWNFVQVPWLLGMVVLFAFEFVEGNTVTRRYFMRLRRMTRAALQAGAITPELEKVRGEGIPTFAHFLDLPILFLIVALGVIRPMSWIPFLVGSVAAVVIATTLTLLIPQLYRWGAPDHAS